MKGRRKIEVFREERGDGMELGVRGAWGMVTGGCVLVEGKERKGERLFGMKQV